MPHIIVEYSDNINLDVQKLVEDLQQSLVKSGIDKARIKSRAIKLEHYVVGEDGNNGAMIHITLLSLEGRDDATKNAHATPLHDIAKKAVDEKTAVTLEVRDIKAQTYSAST